MRGYDVAKCGIATRIQVSYATVALQPVAHEAKLDAGGYVVRCDAWRRRGRDVTTRDVGPFRGVYGWIYSVHRAGLMGGRDCYTYIAANRR